MNDIKKLVEKISEDLAKIHEGKAVDAHFPFSINYMSNFLIEELIPYLYENVVNLDKKTFAKVIRSDIKYPSILAQYFYFIMGSRRFLDEKERFALTSRLLYGIAELREDPFCFNGKNRLKNFNLKNFNFSNKQTSSGQKLNFLLQSYLEFIYPTIMPLGREVHGPYSKDNFSIMVKEYHGLKYDGPESKLIVFEFYKEGANKVDFFNHITEKSSSPSHFYVYHNDHFLSREEIETELQHITKELERLSMQDNKYYLKLFAKGVFNNISPANNNKKEHLLMKINSKIDSTELSEKSFNPYKGLNKIEIQGKLQKSLTRAFGLPEGN